LGDGVDGAAEEEDVQVAGEHVAGVAAGGWGGKGYLQGELLGGGAPGGTAGGRGCHLWGPWLGFRGSESGFSWWRLCLLAC
jgi:hypothetical protein